MNIADITLQGLDNVIGKMEALGGEELVSKGLTKTANAVQGQAKLLAPVDTGDLRDSIKVSDVKGRSVEVFTDSDHAIFNEYGTGTKGDPAVPHTSKESWVYPGTDGNFYTSHGMSPRPFMRPAAEFGRENIGEIFEEVYEKELNKR